MRTFKNLQLIAPIQFTANGGKKYTLAIEDGGIHIDPLGGMSIIGELVEEKAEEEGEKPLKEPPQTQNMRRIRCTMHCSAMVRFMYEGRMRTAAITHTTMKAFRIINTELGVTWIPMHIVRWSVQANQFLVIDEDYEITFTKDVLPGMDVFPPNIDPEELIEIFDRAL